MKTEFGRKISEYLKQASVFFQQRPVLSKVLKYLLWLGFAGCVAFIIVYAVIYTTLPSRAELRKIQNYTSSEVYSEDGVLLGKYYIQDRTNVSYEKISPDAVHALIATEDARFYQHHGVDTRGMLRVLFKSLLLQDESSGGGSTISQQLAKNLYPRKKFWIFSLPLNKLREVILAQKIEDIFSKEEVLTLYLNTVPFGENAYGISSAARRFFNTSADSLKTEEAAVLIGMLKATSSYNPKRNPERAKERRNVVISQMVKYRYLSAHYGDSVKLTPLKLKYNYRTHNEGLATYFREHLRLDLQQWLNEHPKEDGSTYNLYTDGLKIYTTIDSRMQSYAEQAVKQHMNDLQKAFYAHWGKKNPWGNNRDVVEKAVLRSDRYAFLKEEGFSDEEIRKSFQTPVKMKVFSYKGETERVMSPLDSIKYYLKFLQPGFMVMENGTGEIKAWVGGIDYRYFKYDHVNKHTKRQVGSTFKPIVYAAALQQGTMPCEYLPNDKIVYEEYNNWSPRNADNTYGGMYSMKGALTNSVNTISAQLIMKAGIPNVVKLAKNMGIESPLDPVPSLALGTADISLFEMVSAFSVFSNRGVYVKPNMISKVLDSEGNVIYDAKNNRKRKRVLETDKADMMIKMLENVVDHGTGARLRYKYGIDGEVGGKTGTTQQHADGWFIGFTPKLVAGAWVGAEDRRIHFRSLDLGQGATMALPIWGIFMNKVYKDPRFRHYQKASFPIASDDLGAELTCADYIPADSMRDSTDHWWWPFGNRKEQAVLDTDAVRNTPVHHYPAPGRRPERRRYEENTVDKLKNFFRKRRRY